MSWRLPKNFYRNRFFSTPLQIIGFPLVIVLRYFRVCKKLFSPSFQKILWCVIKSAWKITLVIKFVSYQSTLPNKLSCRLIAIRSGCVLAILPPLHIFVCQWIVAGCAIRSPIVKVVRQKLCHCSWPTPLLASAQPLNKALALHVLIFFYITNLLGNIYIGRTPWMSKLN